MDNITANRQSVTLDAMNPCKQHCTQAIYLPTHHFKNTAALTMALDDIQRSLKVNKRKTSAADHNAMLIMLTKNIAITTLELDSDYRGKIDLINAAIAHPLLRQRPFFIRFIHVITRLILKWFRLNEPINHNEAQNILHQAKIAIYQSRNSIILC